MTYLDIQESDDSEQPDNQDEVDGIEDDSEDDAQDDAEETGDGDEAAGEAEEPAGDDSDDAPEFEGRKKEIDDLRKSLQSDLAATTLFRGSITIKMGEFRDGNRSVENELWTMMMDQLEITAENALKKFTRLKMEPHDLINEVFPRLSSILAEEEIKNRQHFYGIASFRFRWALLRELRKHRLPTVPLEEAANVPAPDTKDELSTDDLYYYVILKLDKLSEKSREVMELMFFMGFKAPEIAVELDIGLRTVYDHLDRALDELTNILFTDDNNLRDDLDEEEGPDEETGVPTA